MTEAEAINILQLNTPFVASKEANKAVEVAINALEKQIAKKPIVQGLGQRYCSVCGCGGANHQYCARCGQKLDSEV